MVDIDVAIESLDRHIQKIEAVISFLIKSYLDSLKAATTTTTTTTRTTTITLDGDDLPLPYELKRKITTAEEELSYAMRLRRNLQSLKQQGMTTYSSPERYTNIGNNIIRYFEYGPHESKKVLVPLHGLGASAKRWSSV